MQWRARVLQLRSDTAKHINKYFLKNMVNSRTRRIGPLTAVSGLLLRFWFSGAGVGPKNLYFQPASGCFYLPAWVKPSSETVSLNMCLQSCAISTSWELVRNAKSQVPPQMGWVRISLFTTSPGDSRAPLSWEALLVASSNWSFSKKVSSNFGHFIPLICIKRKQNTEITLAGLAHT